MYFIESFKKGDTIVSMSKITYLVDGIKLDNRQQPMNKLANTETGEIIDCTVSNGQECWTLVK